MRVNLLLPPILLLALVVPAPAPLQAADSAAPDPRLPYRAQKGPAVTYQADFRAIVTAPYHTKVLRVWMPVPPSDNAQEVSGSEFSTFPLKVTPRLEQEEVFGNRFAYFEFEKPEGAQIIQHRFKIKTWELRWNLEAAKVEAVAGWPRTFEPYLRGESQAVVVDDRLRGLAASIVPAKHSAALDVAALMKWVNVNLTYDHASGSLAASSVHALERRAGHCSDYHGLCASLGRALGYPARVTYGMNAFPKNSPSHCKLEVFLHPYGWVSFDVSETQRLVTEIQKDGKLDAGRKAALIRAANARLLSGFRDNTWFLQTRGTDYELAPKASRKVPVVRTIYAEADGVPLPEPDPANPAQKEYSWMTSQEFVPDVTVPYPFKDVSTLRIDLE